MQVAQQQQQQMQMQMQVQGQHGQQGHGQQQPQGSMPAVPGCDGRAANSVQLQTLQSPPRCATISSFNLRPVGCYMALQTTAADHRSRRVSVAGLATWTHLELL